MNNKHDLQLRIIELSGVPISVGHAMDCWSEWMKRGSACRGYPKASVGFCSGNLNSIEDMDESAAIYAARAVDGAIQSLEFIPRNVIGAIWLGHSLHAHVNIEETAKDALKIIYKGLQIRGVA